MEGQMKTDYKLLPVGAWFLEVSEDCLDKYSVQERTSGGYTIVCSTPYHNDRAREQLEEIVDSHNTKLEAKCTPQQT
jgi:hypothetical protein